MKNKVLLIGWDAADWKIINPLIEKGLLPNLAKLIQEGVSGNLMTLDPPNSPMLWTSIATGKRPHKHGIRGFIEPDSTGSNVREVLVTSRKVKAVWNMLMQKDYKVHQVNWWPSHPAEPVNGTYISNFYQLPVKTPIQEPWPMMENMVHPTEQQDLFAALRVHPDELTWAHLQPFIPNGHQIDLKDEQTHELLKRLKTILAASVTAHSAATYILEQEDWDFMAVYYVAIDEFSHFFMRYHPPHQEHIPSYLQEIFSNVMTAAYRHHDMMLGKLIKLAGEEATVVLVSDHGFHSDHLRVKHIPKVSAGRSWEHNPYGIFAMKGPNIHKGKTIHGASLIDMTPTLLAHLGEPVALDMDGKVLATIFQKVPEIKTINTWETVPGDGGMHPENRLEEPTANQAALDHLIALGYVAELSADKEKDIQDNIDENDFYIALSYIDVGQYSKAIPVLRRLYKSNPTQLFYGHRLASCYLQVQETALAKEIVQTFGEIPTSITLLGLKAMIAIQEDVPQDVIASLELAAANKPQHAGLHRHLGLVYKSLNELGKAEKAFEIAIENDHKDHHAHHYLGQVLLEQEQPIRAVEMILASIQLRYLNPHAHFDLAKALVLLKEYEQAVQAFEIALHIMPNLLEAKRQLLSIYTQYIPRPEKVVALQAQLPDDSLPEIIIVSGLPRSGTSMMMQMLDKGGIPMFTDAEREADANNPKGYYEHEAVKNLAQESAFMAGATDKAIKIIAQLLFHLPANYRYKIVFMEREIEEVLQSQQQMLLRLGKTKKNTYSFKIWKNFHDTIDKVKSIFDDQPNVDFLFVQHAHAIEKPTYTAKKVQAFLDRPMDIEQMINVVDKKLHREKVAD